MAKKRHFSIHFERINFLALAGVLVLLGFCIISAHLLVSAEEENNEETGSANTSDLIIPGETVGVVDLSEKTETEPEKTTEETKTKETVELKGNFSLKRLIANISDQAIIDKLKQDYGATLEKTIKNTYTIVFSSEENTKNAYQYLKENNIEVITDFKLKLSETDNTSVIWGVNSVGATSYKTWYQLTGDAGNREVTVAVLDSGINKTHDVFTKNGSNRILTERAHDYVNNDNDPTDENGHGTGVSGIIAEATPSNVKIIPLQVANASGSIDFFAVISAFDDLINSSNKVDIVNLSFTAQGDISQDNIDFMEDYLFAPARQAGMLVVAAAGNQGEGVVGFPASCPSVVAVSSVNSEDNLSDFSNYGTGIEFAMPGEDLTLPWTGGNSMYSIHADGTSFSSPLLAASAALVKLENPTLTPSELIAKLKEYSIAKSDTTRYGNGIVNFNKTLFNNPRIKLATTATDWVETDTITVKSVAGSAITHIDGSLNQPLTAFNWRASGTLQNYLNSEIDEINENGTYHIYLKTVNNTTSHATITETHIDNTEPNTLTQPSVSEITASGAKLSASFQDSQSGIIECEWLIKNADDSGNSYAVVNAISGNTPITGAHDATVTLSNLEANTRYEAYAVAGDKLGHAAITNTINFVTAEAPSDGSNDYIGEVIDGHGDITDGNDDNDEGDHVDEHGTIGADESNITATTAPEEVKTSTNPVTADTIATSVTVFTVSGAAFYLGYRAVARRRH